MSNYVEIKHGRKRHIVQLAGKPTKDGMLSGFRVNKGGEHVSQETKTHSTRHLHVFKQEDIVRKWRMNNHYAELEPIKEDMSAPTNSMGSSSTSSGPIQGFDPLMKKKPLRRLKPFREFIDDRRRT